MSGERPYDEAVRALTEADRILTLPWYDENWPRRAARADMRLEQAQALATLAVALELERLREAWSSLQDRNR